MNYIYRDYSCSLSKTNCSDLLRALAICKGSITDFSTLNNAFPPSTVGRWSGFFRLRFRDQDSLDNFHALGFETKNPIVASVC